MNISLLTRLVSRLTSSSHNRRQRRVSRSLPETLEARILLAVASQLLADINTNVEPADLANARSFTALGNDVFFVAEHAAVGTELWATNIIDGETRLVRELVAGPVTAELTDLTAAGGFLYLRTRSDLFGSGFWKSDGTSEGTRPVQFAPADDVIIVSSPLFAHEDRLYFTALCSGTVQVQNFVYGIDSDPDATPVRVSETALDNYDNDQPDRFTAAGGYLYVKGSINYQPVILSVHESGTTTLLPIPGGRIFPLGDSVLIVSVRISAAGKAVNDLWVSDGTLAGTVRLPELSQLIVWPIEFESISSDGAHIWFVTNRNYEALLWRTDGTISGTESFSMPQAANRLPLEGQTAAGKYYVLMRRSPSDLNQLWVSDGTQSGTYILSDEVAWPQVYGPALLPLSDGLAVATARTGFQGIWFTNGNDVESRVLIAIPKVQSFSVWNVSKVGDEIYASYLPVGSSQTEIRRTTASHTSSSAVVANGTAPSSPKFFFSDEWTGTTLFTAMSPEGPGIWRSDGTAGGTTRLQLTNSSLTDTEIASSPQALTTEDGQLFLFVRGNSATELWGLHPATASATLVITFPASATVSLEAVSWGKRILFSVRIGSLNQLWASGGTPATTSSIHTLSSIGSDDVLIGLAALNDQYFVYMTRSELNGRELWISDGFVARSTRLKSFASFSDAAEPFVMKRVGNQVLFSADDGINGNEMWVTNGTTTGTRLLKDIALGADDSIVGEFRATPQRLFFVAATETGEQSWWVTDGTTNGTRRIINSNPVNRRFGAEVAAATGRRLFLARPHELYGDEVLGFDGETVSTLAQFNRLGQGNRVVLDTFFAAFDRLYFVVDEAKIGRNLWTSDGAESGTQALVSGSDYIPAQDQFSGIAQKEVWGLASGRLLYSGWAGPASFEPISVSPEGGSDVVSRLAIVQVGERNLLKWDALVGADRYLVELSATHGPAVPPTFLYSHGTSLLVPEELRGVPLRVRVLGEQGTRIHRDWSESFVVLTGNQPVILPLFTRTERLEAPAISWILPDASADSEIWINDLERNERVVHLTGFAATTFQPDGLRSSRYAVWVRASSPTQVSSWSAAATFDVLAGSPTITLDSADQQDRTRRVSWQAVRGAFGYELQLRRTDNLDTSVRKVILGSGANGWTTPPLPGGAYEITMRTLAPGRPASLWSNQIVFIIRAAPLASVSSTKISWQAIGAASGYEVRVLNMVTGAVSFTASQSGLAQVLPTDFAPGRYRADVRTLHSDGTASNWNTSRFERFAAPMKVIVRSASTVDATPIISWGSAVGVVSYETVVQHVDSQSSSYRATVTGTTSHRVSTPLLPGKYQIWVRAHFANGGRSFWGPGVSLSVGAPPVIRLAGDRIVWVSVTDATRYEVHMNRSDLLGATETRYFRNEHIFRTAFALPQLLPGYYRIWLRGHPRRGRRHIPVSLERPRDHFR